MVPPAAAVVAATRTVAVAAIASNVPTVIHPAAAARIALPSLPVAVVAVVVPVAVATAEDLVSVHPVPMVEQDQHLTKMARRIVVLPPMVEIADPVTVGANDVIVI